LISHEKIFFEQNYQKLRNLIAVKTKKILWQVWWVLIADFNKIEREPNQIISYRWLKVIFDYDDMILVYNLKGFLSLW
jgi:hypothetical protein